MNGLYNGAIGGQHPGLQEGNIVGDSIGLFLDVAKKRVTNNSLNTVIASGVIRGLGDTNNGAIIWNWITAGGHAFDLFDATINTDVNGNIIITQSGVKKVLAFLIGNDDSYSAAANSFVGCNPGLTTNTIARYGSLGNYGGTLQGNGTNWSNLEGDLGLFNFVSNTISDVKFNPPKPYGNTGTNGQNLNYWRSASARYVGTRLGVTVKKTLFYRGVYDASGNSYPTTNGSGLSGAILKGDVFYLSVGGTLNSTSYIPGDSLTSLVDTPGQTNGNWQRDVGGGPIFGYQLIVNATNTAVVANSSADMIDIYTSTPNNILTPANINDANGWPGVLGEPTGGSTNYWIIAIFQV